MLDSDSPNTIRANEWETRGSGGDGAPIRPTIYRDGDPIDEALSPFPWGDGPKPETFVVKDSGKREEMATGSVRDSGVGKGKPSLASPFAERRLWAVYEKGAAKYNARNWELGQPFARVVDSLKRHINAYQLGDRSEDHLGAILFNASALIHYEEMIKLGKLPAELDDLPRYM